jgi:hypothetical protein
MELYRSLRPVELLLNSLAETGVIPPRSFREPEQTSSPGHTSGAIATHLTRPETRQTTRIQTVAGCWTYRLLAYLARGTSQAKGVPQGSVNTLDQDCRRTTGHARRGETSCSRQVAVDAEADSRCYCVAAAVTAKADQF